MLNFCVMVYHLVFYKLFFLFHLYHTFTLFYMDNKNTVCGLLRQAKRLEATKSDKAQVKV